MPVNELNSYHLASIQRLEKHVPVYAILVTPFVTELHTKASHSLLRNELGHSLRPLEGSDPAEIQKSLSLFYT